MHSATLTHTHTLSQYSANVFRMALRYAHTFFFEKNVNQDVSARETEMENIAWWFKRWRTTVQNITRNTLAIQPPGDEHVRLPMLTTDSSIKRRKLWDNFKNNTHRRRKKFMQNYFYFAHPLASVCGVRKGRGRRSERLLNSSVLYLNHITIHPSVHPSM